MRKRAWLIIGTDAALAIAGLTWLIVNVPGFGRTLGVVVAAMVAIVAFVSLTVWALNVLFTDERGRQ